MPPDMGRHRFPHLDILRYSELRLLFLHRKKYVERLPPA